MPDDSRPGRAAPGDAARRRPEQWTADDLDPVVRSGYREAITTLALWLAAAIYSVTYCVQHGYKRPVESLTFVLWFPDWVFWGLIIPWIVCTLASIFIALFVIQDEPLTSAADAPTEDTPPDDAKASAAGKPGGGA